MNTLSLVGRRKVIGDKPTLVIDVIDDSTNKVNHVIKRCYHSESNSMRQMNEFAEIYQSENYQISKISLVLW